MVDVSSRQQRRDWMKTHHRITSTVIGASWGLLCTIGLAMFAGWQALATGVIWVPVGVLLFGPILTKRILADDFGKQRST